MVPVLKIPALSDNGVLDCAMKSIPRPHVTPTTSVPPPLAPQGDSSGDFVLDEKLVDHVFRTPFNIVKSIPRTCRLVFSCALKSILFDVATNHSSMKPWVPLILLPC